MNDPSKHHIEDQENNFFVCSLCECPIGTHFYFVECPLLEDEVVCIDCCQTGVANDNAIEEFKKLGLIYTREHIDTTCKQCGNRCVKGQP